MYKLKLIKLTIIYIPEYWRVAPRMESTMLPNKPPIPPRSIMGHWGAASSRTALSTVYNTVKKWNKPIKTPPKADTISPIQETPPFVPEIFFN